MAGLFSYVSQHGCHEALRVAGTMGERMRHRDYVRIDIAPAGTTGAVGRLGIGLLNRRPQPARAALGDAGEASLFLCGEFYYQDRLRAELESTGVLAPGSDDADLALQVYLSGGADALASLEGMFVVAVWDDRTRDLWVVNDRYGLYPHYYAHTGGAFALAPEIKGVLAAPGIPRTLDLTAVAQYTRFQQILGERTWLMDVHVLPPATILNYRPACDRLTLHRYWDWDQIEPLPADMSLDEAAEEASRLLRRSIDARTRPPLRVGVFLSGGLDGRAILGYARHNAAMTTLTFGAPGCRDVHYAEKIAKRAGSDHHWFPMRDGAWVLDHADEHLTLTEGQHSWMHAHGITMLTAARQLVDVNLSGWGGGTTIGGYMPGRGRDPRYRHFADQPTMEKVLFDAFCYVITWPGMTDEESDALYRAPGNTAMRGLAFDSFREELARTAHYPGPNRTDYFYILQHCRRSTQNMIVFARSAIEARCPFFDDDFVSFIYGLPERLRTAPGLQHAVISRAMPDLARIPNEKDGLPPHTSTALRTAYRVAGRARRMVNRAIPLFPDRPWLYADYENYLRGELAAWAEGVLFAPSTLNRGLFNQTTVRELWDQHQRGDRLWTIGKIAPLITLEQVLRRFVDDD